MAPLWWVAVGLALGIVALGLYSTTVASARTTERVAKLFAESDEEPIAAPILARQTRGVTMGDRRDEVWQAMASVVHSNRDSWRRAVIDRSGLPFSRLRILRRSAMGHSRSSRWPPPRRSTHRPPRWR